MDVREERHEARALYRLFDCALLLGGEASALSVHHTSVRVHELLEEVDIFVVDVPDVILCEDVCAHS